MNAKLIVADHQEIMRLGLKSLIARGPVDIVGEAASEAELLKLLKGQSANVVILDVRFAGEDGFTTLRRVRKKYPELPVLMWSSSDNLTYIARAMALGANGFLTRDLGRTELLAAIRAAATDGKAWTKSQLEEFTGAPELPANCEVPLTPRERQVVRQLGHGLSNQEIALALNISYETVKEHVQHIFRKLRTSDRTVVAVWAVRNGLV